MIIALLVLILVAILFPKFLRFIFGLIGLALLYVLLFASSHAQEGPKGLAFPIYDVESACSRIGANVDPRACMMAEQDAYDFAHVLWNDLGAGTQAECIRISSKPTPRPYGVLKECVAALGERDRLKERLKQNSQFRY